MGSAKPDALPDEDLYLSSRGQYNFAKCDQWPALEKMMANPFTTTNTKGL